MQKRENNRSFHFHQRSKEPYHAQDVTSFQASGIGAALQESVTGNGPSDGSHREQIRGRLRQNHRIESQTIQSLTPASNPRNNPRFFSNVRQKHKSPQEPKMRKKGYTDSTAIRSDGLSAEALNLQRMDITSSSGRPSKKSPLSVSRGLFRPEPRSPPEIPLLCVSPFPLPTSITI